MWLRSDRVRHGHVCWSEGMRISSGRGTTPTEYTNQAGGVRSGATLSMFLHPKAVLCMNCLFEDYSSWFFYIYFEYWIGLCQSTGYSLSLSHRFKQIQPISILISSSSSSDDFHSFGTQFPETWRCGTQPSRPAHGQARGHRHRTPTFLLYFRPRGITWKATVRSERYGFHSLYMATGGFL